MIIDFIRGWEKKSTEKFHVPFPQFLSNLGSDVGAPHSVFGAPQLCGHCSVCVCGPAWLCPHARACPRPTAGLRAAPSLPASRHAHAPPGPSATAASLSISVVLFHEIILWSSLAGWRTLESFIFGTACCCLLSTRYSRGWLFAAPWTVAWPGSCVHGILRARILEWVAVPRSRGSPDSGIRPASPVVAGGLLTPEPPGKPLIHLSSDSNADERACEIPGLNDGPSLVCFYISP